MLGLSCSSFLFSQQDSLKRKLDFSVLPFANTSPETGLKIGILGIGFFDLAKESSKSRQSQANMGISYSLKKQFEVEVEWQLFGRDEKYFSTGEMGFRNWVDKHYGLGNDANAFVLEYNFEEDRLDTLNFMNYKINLFYSRFFINQKVKPHWFAGWSFDFESGSQFDFLADSTIIKTDEIELENLLGQRLGLGFNVIYDTRKYVSSPLKAVYIQITNLYYIQILGADYGYTNLRLDARKYFQLFEDQSIALRLVSQHIFAKKKAKLPLTGLPRMGGKDFFRGYFEGTFRDRHLLSFQAAWRIPLWQDDEAPIWKIWKHFGVVLFVSAGKVYPDLASFNLKDFRLAAGTGIRISLNPEQRTNVRLDYGIGFYPNAAGVGKRQSGVYATLNEAF